MPAWEILTEINCTKKLKERINLNSKYSVKKKKRLNKDKKITTFKFKVHALYLLCKSVILKGLNK